MHIEDALSLLLYALGAFVIPLGAGRVGVPAAVGEILYGLLVGPHVLGLIQGTPLNTLLAELGFAFLMFLVGLEIDFSRIERQRPRSHAIGVIVAGGTFLVSYWLTLALQLSLFMTLVFGAMSVGILLVTLTEARMTRTETGQALIFVGSIGEALTIVALTGLSFYYRFGFGMQLAVAMAKLVAIFVTAYFVLVLLRTLIWWRPASFARVVTAHDPAEIGVRASMALMLAFVAFAALLGVEGIVGAFLAGALASFVFRDRGFLEAKLSSIGFGFFIPIFFIRVGADFDLSAVANQQAWLRVGIFLAASAVAKLLPSLLLLLRGLSLRDAIGGGLLLSAPLTLLVAIARIGLDVRVIDRTTGSAIVLLAILTGVIFPWLFRLLVPSPDVNAAAPHHAS